MEQVPEGLREAAADGVAVAHLAAVVLLLVGAPLALRFPGLVRVHAVVAGSIAAVYVLGADCPVTGLERWLRGEDAYEGGFLEHYVVRPLHPAGITPAVDRVVLATALVPNLLGYGLLLHRRRRTRGGDTAPRGTLRA